MSEKTLKINGIEVNKKEFHVSKQPIALNAVLINTIIVSDKFEYSGKGFKYFIGYTEDDIIRPVCTVLHQTSGYIKYFDNGGKSMYFKIEDDNVLVKYNEIWNRIKKKLYIKLHSKPVYDENYIKAKIKTFNRVVTTIL